MILIVDSGSTKADWIALDDKGDLLHTFETLGLNPEVLTKDELVARMLQSDILSNSRSQVKQLFFYGAGCGTDRMKLHLEAVLAELFENAYIKAVEDTYAAVYATTPKDEKAIVCILGTGSNCSYFDGEKVIQKVQSLGYMIMDDASGNQFGRQLIRGYYFNQMPKELALDFEKKFDVAPDAIKHHLYKMSNPNAYMATFAPFLFEHQENEFIQNLIHKELQVFVDNHVKQFEDCHQIPVHFIGSIAFQLRAELATIFAKNGLHLGTVLRKPLDGLVTFHKNNLV